MLALTLKHPWPFAVLHLGKRVENRTWRPPASLVGRPFAVHGGKPPGGRDDLDHVADVARALIARHPAEAAAFMADRGLDDITLADVIVPGVVAVARLKAVVASSDSPWFEGPWGWVLDDMAALPESVPCRGAQGLWELPPGVTGEVEAALACCRSATAVQ